MLVEFAATPQVMQLAVEHVAATWTWYLIRGAGLVAAALLVLLMLSGIGQVTGILYRWIEPLRAWAIHKAMAYALLASIVLHVAPLMIDKYLPFSFAEITVPFISQYNNKTNIAGLPVENLAMGFGVLATYLAIIIVASSLGWINTKTGLWRFLHYSSYVCMLLVFLHGAYTGFDLRDGALRFIWVTGGILLIAALVIRVYHARARKKVRSQEQGKLSGQGDRPTI